MLERQATFYKTFSENAKDATSKICNLLNSEYVTSSNLHILFAFIKSLFQQNDAAKSAFCVT